MLAVRLVKSGKCQVLNSCRLKLPDNNIFKSYNTSISRSCRSRPKPQPQTVEQFHHPCHAFNFKTLCAVISTTSRLTTRKFHAVTVLLKGHISRHTYNRSFHHRAFSSQRRPFEIDRNVSKDVLVYSHKNDSFYKMLSYFGLFQMAMWGYLALFAVRHLKKAPAAIVDTADLPWWKSLLYKEGQYKNALSLLCLVVGGTVLFITMTYPRRAVRSLWILKGGQDVQFTTYTWLGRTQTFRKPVEHIDCLQSRTGSGYHIPLKLKGKNFYYLLDKQGEFHNTDLFDYVIGVKRNF